MPTKNYPAGTMIKIRPLTPEDVKPLLRGESIQVFEPKTDGLIPVTMRISPRKPKPIYPTELVALREESPARHLIKGAEPVGLVFYAETKSLFGGSSEYCFANTEEAVEEVQYQSHRFGRVHFNSYVIEDPTSEQEMPLVPIFGTEATVKCFINGLDPEETQARIEKALAKEFGDEQDIVVQTRYVHDRRVNVYQSGLERDSLVAVNVLSATISRYMKNGHVLTEPASDLVVDVGQTKQAKTLRVSAR